MYKNSKLVLLQLKLSLGSTSSFDLLPQNCFHCQNSVGLHNKRPD